MQALEALEQAAIDTLSDHTPQGVSVMLQSLSKLDYMPLRLCLAVRNSAASHAYEYECQHIANLLYAYAKLGFVPGVPLLRAMVASAALQIAEFTGPDLCNYTWALVHFHRSGKGPLREYASPAPCCFKFSCFFVVVLLFCRFDLPKTVACACQS